MSWNNNLFNIKEWMIRNLRHLAWIFGGVAVTTVLIASQLCVVFVSTNSIPYSICLQMRHVTPQKYDLCAFK